MQTVNSLRFSVVILRSIWELHSLVRNTFFWLNSLIDFWQPTELVLHFHGHTGLPFYLVKELPWVESALHSHCRRAFSSNFLLTLFLLVRKVQKYGWRRAGETLMAGWGCVIALILAPSFCILDCSKTRDTTDISSRGACFNPWRVNHDSFLLKVQIGLL